MKALVTGGAGFVGSHLVDRLLAEDHEVEVIDDLSTGSLPNLAEARADRSRRFTFHRLDIRQPDLVDLVKHRQPEVVFHFAAQASVAVSVAQPVYDAEVNVVGSLNVLQGALAAGARKVVFMASGGTLYGMPEDLPTKAVKCDLCRNDSAGPACVRSCPTGAAMRVSPDEYFAKIGAVDR